MSLQDEEEVRWNEWWLDFHFCTELLGEEVMSEEGVMEIEEVQEAEMGVLDALKEVFKKAALYDGLRRGIHE